MQVFRAVLKAKDKGLLKHSIRVSELSTELALKTHIADRWKLEDIRMGAFLHDIGKLHVSDSILLKDESLTDREWEAMELHPAFGDRFLKSIDRYAVYSLFAKLHHELPDGSGYPNKLTLDDIPPAARIISVADKFSALTEQRPYRDAAPPEFAIEKIRHHVEAYFDHETAKVIDVLMKYRFTDSKGD